jgi:uncharacterized protein involved in outer membrane biogenesis
MGGTLLILTAIAAVGLETLNERLDRLIESNLTQALRVEVTLEEVKIQPWRLGIQLQGLSIANPPAFSSQPILTVEQAFIQVVPQSLRAETLEFKQIAIEGLNLRWEQQDASSNVISLVNRIQAQSQPGEPQTRLDIPVLIEQLRLQDSQISAQLNLFGSFGLEQSFPVPDIELDEIDVERLASELIPTLLKTLREQFLPWLQNQQDIPTLDQAPDSP